MNFQIFNGIKIYDDGLRFKLDENGNVVPNPHAMICSEAIGVDILCCFGHWRENIAEGNYTVWPNRGLELRDGCVVELVENAVIGPPVGQNQRTQKPELKFVDNDEWKNKKMKGVFVIKDKQTLAVN